MWWALNPHGEEIVLRLVFTTDMIALDWNLIQCIVLASYLLTMFQPGSYISQKINYHNDVSNVSNDRYIDIVFCIKYAELMNTFFYGNSLLKELHRHFGLWHCVNQQAHEQIVSVLLVSQLHKMWFSL